MLNSPLAVSALKLAPMIYVGTLAAVLSLLVFVYAYLVTHRGRANAWSAVERWFDSHLPRFWAAVRHVVSRAGRRRLGIASLLALFATVAYFFAEVADSWRSEDTLFLVDQRVYQALSTNSEPTLELAFKRITHLGSLEVALAVSLFLLAGFLYRRQKRRAVALAMVMGLGEALAWGLKFLFARQRPEDTLVQAAGDAFPSGHSFTAAALYGFIIYLVWARTRHHLWRAVLTSILGTVALLVGVSRIILRVHWFSDVLGGFTLGLGWLVCCLLLMRVLEVPSARTGSRAGTATANHGSSSNALRTPG